MTPRRIAVVGGGISGLAAAFTLAEARRAGAPIEEYLVEGSTRLGGAICTERIEGCVVETGADSFLTEKSKAIELCHQLGLTDQLIGSEDTQRRTWILHQGRLVPLPEGFEFMVPTRLWAVARSPLLTLRDKLALAAEVVRRPPPPAGDESVARFIERHFSRGLLETVVDPLLTAVYGGDSEQLSAAAVLPRFVEMERRWGSLVRGVRQTTRQRKNHGEGRSVRPPLFSSLRDGLETLVQALSARLDSSRVFTGRPVVGLARTGNGGAYRVAFAGSDSLNADALVLALPAHESARLVHGLDAALADRLAEIPYSSSMIVALSYEARSLPRLPSGFGFLVPPKERRRLLACTFVGQKFRSRVPASRVLLRCFLGGMRDEAVLELSDAEAATTVRRELAAILGISAEPQFLKVYRWPKALAQYTVGHQERLQAIQARLGRHRGLSLCGNAYQGIGIPDCLRSGRAAAEECLRGLQGG